MTLHEPAAGKIPGSRASDQLAVSVVVPTCRRPDLLDRCLDALLRQDFPPARFEVIVADDAACEETRYQVAAWAFRAKIQSVCLRYRAVPDTHGPAAARNAGWRAARGEIIAFTDDDCIPAPDWLSIGVAAFEDATREQPIDGVTGRIDVPLSGAPSDYQRNAAQLAQAEFATANCFYRRDALAAVDGFDERFAMAWREDSDLRFRLMERGACLIAVSNAVVTHPVRPARWGISIQQQRKSMYNALLYREHPRLYRRHIQAAAPWRYYAILGALLSATSGLLGGRRWLAWLSAAVWSALTLEFCLRRLRGASHAPAHVAEMAVTSLVIPPLAIFWRIRGALRFRILFL